MEWKDLLNTEKLGEKGKTFRKYEINTFERDYSKIVSSSAFRRLQDKTQVYPLDDSDFARTRLTHSIEVSTIAYQMGQMLAVKVPDVKDRLDDIPSLLRCAGVLHDLGNPPFGHFGEATIGLWFQENLDKVECKGKTLRTWLEKLNEEEYRNKLPKNYQVAASHEKLGDEAIDNLEEFEGNAQALRLLCKARYAGDIDVTYAVISSLVKYPTDSLHADKDDPDIKRHKQGVYAAEADVFDTISDAVGTKLKRPDGTWEYCRHPLTFIMEASDDIAYATSDLEDSYRKGMFTLQQLREHFRRKLLEKGREFVGKDEQDETLDQALLTAFRAYWERKKASERARETLEKMCGEGDKDKAELWKTLNKDYRDKPAKAIEHIRKCHPAKDEDDAALDKVFEASFRAYRKATENEKSAFDALEEKTGAKNLRTNEKQLTKNAQKLWESAAMLWDFIEGTAGAAPGAEKASREAQDREEGRAFSEWLSGVRAKLMNCAVFTFSGHRDEIMEGKFKDDMFKGSFQEIGLAVIKSAMAEFVYDDPKTSPTEISGHNSLSFLLDGFVHAVLYADEDYQEKDKTGKPKYKPTDKDKKYWRLLSEHFLEDYYKAKSGCEPFDLYLRLLTVTDHISAMTDTYAHDLAAKLRGY